MEETKIHFQIQNVVVGVELQLSEMATKYRPISLTTDKISSFTYECAKTVAGNLCISPVLGQFQGHVDVSALTHSSTRAFYSPKRLLQQQGITASQKKDDEASPEVSTNKQLPYTSYLSSGPVSILLAAYFGSDFLSSRQTQIFTTAAFVKDCNSQPSSSAVDSSSHRSAEDEEHVCSK